MAIGKKTGGRDFEPGNSASPGRPQLPEDLKQARKLNKAEFERIANKFLFLSPQDARDILEDPTSTMLDHLVASIFVRGVQDGSHQHLEFILNRLIGKVSDKIEVKQKPFVVERLDGTEVVMGHKAIEEKDEE